MGSRRSAGRRGRRRALALVLSKDFRSRAGKYGVVALIAVGALWVAWLSGAIARDVRASERFYLDTWERELTSVPGWVTPEIRGDLASVELVDAAGRLNLFQSGVLRRLRRILEASPWVRAVGEISFRYPTSSRPGAIFASVHLRPPVALVRAGGYHYLTDDESRRLGEPYDTAPRDWFRVPVIAGLEEPVDVPPAGEKWQARDVVEGVAVAAVLHREGILRDYPSRPIETIDVSNVSGRLRPAGSEIVLLCKGRSLEWGRSPLSRNSRTITTAQLVENLRDVLRHMDARPFKRVKLYYPRVVVDNS